MSAGAVYLVLSAYATAWLLRNDLYEESVLRNQLIMIWILPFVGAILSIAVGRSHLVDAPPKQTIGNNPNVSEEQAKDFGLTSDD